jgi:hypothetical protein
MDSPIAAAAYALAAGDPLGARAIAYGVWRVVIPVDCVHAGMRKIPQA